jgi:diaminopimelate decarboxylase
MPHTKKNHGLALSKTTFKTQGPDLMIGDVSVADIARETGGPTFVYDAAIIRSQYRGLAKALHGFADIYYSVKSNPNPSVISVLHEEGAGAEIASVGEYRAARAAGVPGDRVIFAGPGKRKAELAEVIDAGIGEIHIESLEEVQRLLEIGRPVKASIRINPVPSAQAGAMRMGGKPTAFGFDEEDMADAVAAITAVGAIDLVGVHIYGGTQILDADALVTQWRHGIDIAARLATLIGKPLQTIDLGGGLGIPYFAGEAPLDLDVVAFAVPDLIATLKANPLLAEAHIIVEPGRFLVGTSGIYVAEVNAVKMSRGTCFAVTDGGMHHHLAASGNLGQIVKRNYPVVVASRMNEPHDKPVTVVGPLCTPLDTLGRNVLLPAVKAGDFIAVLQSGAYGATASPGRFLSHPDAIEVLVDNGEFRVI